MSKKIQYEHIVQYYETDQMKIVHHSNYIRWFEEARIAWMKEMGMPCEILEEKGIIIPVVDVSCKYIAMTHFGEEVIVVPAVTKFNGIVINLSYEVFGKESGELKVTGTSSHCFIDKNYKVMALKKTHKEVYEKICQFVNGQE
ncbi:acyl-CoA thioesterase [[Clostridium] polysaccharolyticum]|uniref:Acyl-CoA thioester hydrolase n=1 Tax=[Clostridium] polysaccharolyticum TaxID=29364 RepID=A0A1I0DLI6_9FIRM|nr:acyl-CoA thioesterase [[Clostridium] polysaccharolyticum]SET33208.1 acyl-CoA thioester hydrolase [[Clostridium] polysaccharolyticum]